MRSWLFCAVLLAPAVSLAEDGGKTSEPRASATIDQAVIGGSAAPAGKWPDTVAVLWDGQQACTGTLVAPNIVVTAGHCVLGGAPNGVLVGATKLSRPQEGQTIAIQRWVEYPSSQSTIDAAILVLAKPVMDIAPRPIASGWAKFDIVNGAEVQLVGFGTVDRDANVETDSLMEAATTITDFNCSKSAGCSPAAKPDGELGAGGMGIDTCPGDSGGPAYLKTMYGVFLAGITSRGYDSNQFYCSEGGIYERADKIVDWIDKEAGVKVARGPTPSAEPITAVLGHAAETTIEPNDPRTGTAHTFAITKPPMYATAAVRDDGRVRVCASRNAIGTDTVEVTVTDAGNPARALVVQIPINMQDGTPAESCDVNDFGEDGGGCCDTRRSAGGSIPLAMFVLLVLRRRRK